jgi:triosephosphate isomerase
VQRLALTLMLPNGEPASGSAISSGSVPDGASAANTVVAYEPVWAIGTGLTPTEADIAAVHAAMRAQVGATTRLLYGGSMKPANAAAILALPNVDGGLIGGAALVAADFLAIAKAAG